MNKLKSLKHFINVFKKFCGSAGNRTPNSRLQSAYFTIETTLPQKRVKNVFKTTLLFFIFFD
jgi:hypothetical protein